MIASKLMHEELTVLREEKRLLEGTESENQNLREQLERIREELNRSEDRVKELEKIEEAKASENDELHQDNFDLSQTLQRLKNDCEEQDQEARQVIQKCKLSYIFYLK